EAGKLAPEIAAWIIDGPSISIKNGVPIRIPVCRFHPKCCGLGLQEHFHHVVTRSETELFECEFERERSGASQPRSYNLQCHLPAFPRRLIAIAGDFSFSGAADKLKLIFASLR